MKHFTFLFFIMLTFAHAQEATQINTEATFPTAISNDGTTLFYLNWDSENNGFLWEEGAEVQQFMGGKANDFSFGGNRLIGTVSENINGMDTYVAAYYNVETDEWVSTGIDENIPVSSDSYSFAWGADDTGDKLVGLIYTSGSAFGFAWTQETGYQVLPVPEGTYGSRANGISKQGDAIFGHIVKPNGIWNPCLWVDGEVTVIDDSDNFGDATCASFDGAYVVASNYGNLFIWNAGEVEAISISNEDLTNAGLPDGDLLASSVSLDKTVFGFVNGFGERKSFVYDDSNGLRSFSTYLSELGITGLENYSFDSTVAVSPDKSVLSGSGYDADYQYSTYVINSSMGVNDTNLQNQFSYMVYPTLVEDIVNIRFSDNVEKIQLTLTNAQGQVVFKNHLTQNSSKSFSMVSYPKGTYFLTIQQGSTQKTTKLIKK